MKTVISALFVLICTATASEAQVFLTYGQAYEKFGNGSTSTPAAGFQMKWCKMNGSGQPGTQCATGFTDQSGSFSVQIPSSYGAGYYFGYLWRDDIYWGSESYPFGSQYFLAQTGVSYSAGTVLTTPRALPPQAVFPYDGQVNVDTSFSLSWSNGLDQDRQSSSWPVYYDIYGSGNGAPEILELSNIPCNNPPEAGVCQYPISGLSYTSRWQWRVVAKITSQPVVSGAGDSTFTTSSAELNFSTKWDPSIPVRNLQTYSGNYLRVPGGGGAGVDAAGTGSSYETQFQFVDLSTNSNTINSGDSVGFKTARNYYVSAVWGGGYGVDTQGWLNTYETWTIIRLAGPGTISSGDQVAFRSVYGWYMTAEGGGGGTVNANRTAIGPWETFTFQ